MGKQQPIKVVIRTRPTPDFAAKNIHLDPTDATATVTVPKDPHGGAVNNQTEQWKFKFDKIMHNASQEDVFEFCAKEAVHSVVDGYNGAIMCYGQTGAGKTFSMTGNTTNYKYRGLIPRAINNIFSEVGGRFDNQITVRISFVEIYNELMFDMLCNAPPHEQSGTSITIQDDAKGEVHVKGLTQVHCKNEEEALNCLFEGEQMRATADNSINKMSSRSHAIFTIHIESRSTIEAAEKVIHSKLHLVDLAGNERTKKSGAEGVAMREATYINKSLSFLEQVVVSTCDKKRDHVPYRQCKLTNMLKNSIGGNCKTILIANVWPEAGHIEETISTLKFATRMRMVTNEPVINEALDQGLLIKKYEKEIRDLKQELSLHDSLSKPSSVQYDAYTPEQQYDMQKQCLSFLTGNIEDIEELTSVRQVNELLLQMRNLFRKLKQEGANLLSMNDSLRSEGGQVTAEEFKRRQTMLNEGGVGDVEDQGEFGLGIAPREAKPVTKIEMSKEKEAQIAKMQEWHQVEEDDQEAIQVQEEKAMLERMRKRQNNMSDRRKHVDRQTAFVEYKTTDESKEHENTIVDCRATLKAKRQELKNKTDQCNMIKAEIDRVKHFLDQKTEQKKADAFRKSMAPGFNSMTDGFDDSLPDENDIIDEEELQRLKEMKELKRQYRDSFKELRAFKNETAYCSQAIDRAKQSLVSGFEQWYDDNFEPEGGSIGEGLTSPTSHSSPAKKQVLIRDPAMDEDLEAEDDEREGVDVDSAALAYIRSRKNVHTLAKARKNQ